LWVFFQQLSILQEKDYGLAEGQTYDEVVEQTKQFCHSQGKKYNGIESFILYRPPFGESVEQMTDRGITFFKVLFFKFIYNIF